jgi:hypothetical protein
VPPVLKENKGVLESPVLLARRDQPVSKESLARPDLLARQVLRVSRVLRE